ncbi:uncharacterized protein LOC110930701 isoform X1 [Helianthus annuus]|uniref:uncharacterized protein LOC110930701 isoform X1 n=3 Tax=Helianthus annuus TaxID=4232 RepID=UPI000B900000|nr:uncharacterized protein LOC110930701 isoform X1 [Helianthus annuus]XP_035843649.1 uncharacterized protein LOC110930701 isoform X1 [Helianthus annuus]
MLIGRACNIRDDVDSSMIRPFVAFMCIRATGASNFTPIGPFGGFGSFLERSIGSASTLSQTTPISPTPSTIEITLKSMARCLLDYHQMVIRRSHLRIIILRTGSPRCVLHHLVKKAVDIMSGPKEASSYLNDLERAEYGIREATKVYRCFLPLGLIERVLASLLPAVTRFIQGRTGKKSLCV